MSPSPWTRSGSRARRSRGGTHKTRGGRTNKIREGDHPQRPRLRGVPGVEPVLSCPVRPVPHLSMMLTMARATTLLHKHQSRRGTRTPHPLFTRQLVQAVRIGAVSRVRRARVKKLSRSRKPSRAYNASGSSVPRPPALASFWISKWAVLDLPGDVITRIGEPAGAGL